MSAAAESAALAEADAACRQMRDFISEVRHCRGGMELMERFGPAWDRLAAAKALVAGLRERYREAVARGGTPLSREQAIRLLAGVDQMAGRIEDLNRMWQEIEDAVS